jgi:hypothetical protein
MIAVVANLAFKSAVVAMLGGPALGRRVAAVFGVLIALGVVLLFVWPR